MSTLHTIWTMPAATFGERIRRTGDRFAQVAASRLPKRVRYWTFIQVGAKAIPDDAIVPETYFVDLLSRAEGGPR